MNGASASTTVPTMSSSPVTHKKIASGVSQRLSESLLHNPCASWAIDPNVLPNTISPRWVLPRFLITQPPASPSFCLLGSLPVRVCAWSPELLRRPERQFCNGGMWNTLQLDD